MKPVEGELEVNDTVIAVVDAALMNGVMVKPDPFMIATQAGITA
jgi:hypothetical protein